MENDVEGEVQAWKLFGLIPAMLLHRPKGVGSEGRAELVHRVDDFQQGHWEQLWHRGQAASAKFSRAPPQAPQKRRNINEEAGVPKSGYNRGKSHEHDKS